MSALKRIFLAYPFSLPDIQSTVESACAAFATVAVASDIIRSRHLLEKIDDMIDEADLSLFDFTLHNPNVAVEYGIAYARDVKSVLLFSTMPAHQDSEHGRIFSDLAGLDSIRYESYDHLGSELHRLLPEYLEAPRRRNKMFPVLPTGNGSAHKAHDESIKPRLHVKIAPLYALAMASGRGPVHKFGEDQMNVTLTNKGKGAANDIQTTITGFNFTDNIATLAPGSRASRKWPLENQDPYRTATQCTIRVRYSDDNDDWYEQSGALDFPPRQSGSIFYYSGEALGPPKPIGFS